MLLLASNTENLPGLPGYCDIPPVPPRQLADQGQQLPIGRALVRVIVGLHTNLDVAPQRQGTLDQGDCPVIGCAPDRDKPGNIPRAQQRQVHVQVPGLRWQSTGAGLLGRQQAVFIDEIEVQ